MKNYEGINVVLEPGQFSNVIEQFILYKQGLGFKYGESIQFVLKRLNQQLNQFKMDTPHLSKDTVMRLSERRQGEAITTQSKRISILRQLAKFMHLVDLEAYVYPDHYKLIYYDGFSPYIFSHSDISKMLKIADNLSYCTQSPYRHIVWPAFFRVLYGCGLRISEGLFLKQTHVDLVEGVLFIEHSKNQISRYVPLSKSLHEYLKTYQVQMAPLLDKSDYFFPAYHTLNAYSSNNARTQIKNIYQSANIALNQHGRFPRVHDLRHTFCCHALEQLINKGYDPYYCLPLLSTFVGHQTIRDTERYLHLPQFQYPELALVGNDILKNSIRLEETLHENI